MTARGVESVSSPVGNISLQCSHHHFGMFVAGECRRRTDDRPVDIAFIVEDSFAAQYHDSKSLNAVKVGDAWLENDDVRKGYDELKVSSLQCAWPCGGADISAVSGVDLFADATIHHL